MRVRKKIQEDGEGGGCDASAGGDAGVDVYGADNSPSMTSTGDAANYLNRLGGGVGSFNYGGNRFSKSKGKKSKKTTPKFNDFLNYQSEALNSKDSFHTFRRSY